MGSRWAHFGALSPLGGSQCGKPAVLPFTRSLVLGPGENKKYYDIYWSRLSSGNSLQNARKNERDNSALSCLLSGLEGGSETGLGLANLKGFWPTTDASFKSCWLRLQIGSYGPRHGCVGRRGLANICYWASTKIS